MTEREPKHDMINFLKTKYPNTNQNDINALVLDILSQHDELPLTTATNEEWIPNPNTILNALKHYPLNLVDFYEYLNEFKAIQKSVKLTPTEEAFIDYIKTHTNP